MFQIEEISNATEGLKDKVELLYQQRVGEETEKINEMIEEMLSVVDVLFWYKDEHKEFALDADKLQHIFQDILEAMENHDYTLMADIILYEFIEYAEQAVEMI